MKDSTPHALQHCFWGEGKNIYLGTLASVYLFIYSVPFVTEVMLSRVFIPDHLWSLFSQNLNIPTEISQEMETVRAPECFSSCCIRFLLAVGILIQDLHPSDLVANHAI